MYSFNKYLLNTYNIQNTLIGAMREELLKRHVYLNVKQFHINKAFKYVLFSFLCNIHLIFYIICLPFTKLQSQGLVFSPSTELTSLLRNIP